MWAKEATVAWRFDLEGLEPDWRARSGRVWVSKVNLVLDVKEGESGAVRDP